MAGGKKKKARKQYIAFDYTEPAGNEAEDDDEGGVAISAAVELATCSIEGTTAGSLPSSRALSRASYHTAGEDDTSSATYANKASTDHEIDQTGNQAQAHPLSGRGMAMNQYGTQPSSRQTPRLQNTQKTGLGNGNAGAGWAFGAPASGNAFGGLAGGAPGLPQGRPQQLSGFAQVMGGGSGQGPIDMRYVL